MSRIWRELLEAWRRPRLRAIALCLAVTYAYFVDRAAWNQNSRFALTRALVETRSPIIDDAHTTTGDKSFREGHFYSDKAPGLSVLAALPYGVFYGLRRLGGGQLPAVDVIPLDPLDLAAERAPPPDRMQAGDRLRYNRAWRIAAYLCRVFTVVPLALLGAMALFALAFALARQRQGEGEADPGDPDLSAARTRAETLATWVVLVHGLCTPAFAYATAFYGHRPAGDLLITAGALVFFARPLAGRRARHENRVAAGIAAACGLAVCIEYTAAPVVLVLIAWSAARHGWRFTARVAGFGLPFAVALAAYHRWAFGSPLATGYDFVYLEAFAEGMRVRYGIHAPDPGAAFALLFGSYRGLLATAPILVLAMWGLTRLRGPLPRLAAVIFAYYWLLNAGYYMWDGGAAIGPRHMLPCVPWLCLGLIVCFDRVSRASFVLAVASGLIALLSAYAGPEAPGWGHPIWSYAFGEFADFGAQGSASATNLGRFLGIPGPLSLLPLILVWITAIPRERAPT